MQFIILTKENNFDFLKTSAVFEKFDFKNFVTVMGRWE